jgi:capsular polysaccharide biosynthesis protein
MELILYWRIVRRRIWLLAVLLLAILISYAIGPPAPAAGYSSTMRFVVGIRPEPGRGEYYTYDRYYSWLTAEYLLDDLAEVVRSYAFARDVTQEAGLDVPPGTIRGSTASGKLHRILSVSIAWPDADELERIADAIVRVLLERGHVYFAQLSTEDAVVSLIDPPTVVPVGPSLRQRLDLPLRLIIGLGVAVGLAFLLDYVDISIRHRGDLESLGVTVLAEIPRRRRRLGRLLRREPTT